MLEFPLSSPVVLKITSLLFRPIIIRSHLEATVGGVLSGAFDSFPTDHRNLANQLSLTLGPFESIPRLKRYAGFFAFLVGGKL